MVFDSVRGVSHVQLDAPCQDACRALQLSYDEHELLLIACADGAGSAAQSDVGSALACDKLVDCVQRHAMSQSFLSSVNQEMVTEWVREIKSCIEERAADLNVRSRQLATTLLVALIGDDDAVFFQIGDGAILARSGDEFRVVFWPQSGEYANTTNFITDDEVENKLVFEKYAGQVSECVMFTDGLERLILQFEGKTVHRPFIEPMLSRMRQSATADCFFQPLRQFLDSAAINERTDDDKTLVLATRLVHEDDEPLS